VASVDLLISFLARVKFFVAYDTSSTLQRASQQYTEKVGNGLNAHFRHRDFKHRKLTVHAKHQVLTLHKRLTDHRRRLTTIANERRFAVEREKFFWTLLSLKDAFCTSYFTRTITINRSTSGWLFPVVV